MIDKTEQLPDYISVASYGATGKGIADDTAAIQKTIDDNPRSTIYFPAGEYRISAPIRLYADGDHSNNLVLDHSARIFTNEELDTLLFIGDKTYGTYNRWNDEGRRYIIGGIFDGNHTQKAIHLLSCPQLIRFEALKIVNFEHYGFYCEQTDGIYSADFELADSWIIGKSSFCDSECTGIYTSAGDNAFSNLRIDGCVVSMDLHSGGNFVSNKCGKKIRYKTNRRPSQSKHNSKRSQAQIKRREHEKSSVRAKIEHVFGVVKGQLRFRKTRYRGLQKQTAKLNMMFALANLILADRPCLTV